MDKKKYRSSFGEGVCHFINRKSSMTGDHWKLRAKREERELESAQILYIRRTFIGKTPGPWKEGQSRLGVSSECFFNVSQRKKERVG